MRFNKYLPIALSALTFTCVSQLALAGGLGNLTANANQFYVNIGGGSYYLNNSPYKVGTLGLEDTSTTPLAKIDNSGFTPQYNLAFGYQFCNPASNWITMLFGHDNAVELSGTYFHRSSNNSRGNQGVGTIYYIDGSGNIRPAGSSTVYSSKLKAKQRNINANLYFKGNKQLANPRLFMTPLLGIIYQDFKTEYNFSANYDSGAVPAVNTSTEDDTVKTHYYGLAFGDGLSYFFTPQFSTFVNLELQALIANAKLTANQNAAVGSVTPLTKKVTDSENKLTYRAILALGANYKFSTKPNAINLELRGGIDRWGYNPKVVTPNSTTSKKIHLANDAINNYFATLELHVPFG